MESVNVHDLTKVVHTPRRRGGEIFNWWVVQFSSLGYFGDKIALLGKVIADNWCLKCKEDFLFRDTWKFPQFMSGWMHNFNFSKVNAYKKYKICYVYVKYNIIFYLTTTNLYNLVILVVSTNIKLKFLKNFEVVIIPWCSLDPSLTDANATARCWPCNFGPTASLMIWLCCHSVCLIE